MRPQQGMDIAITVGIGFGPVVVEGARLDASSRAVAIALPGLQS
jgi:precorrin-6B methylase 2